jgi:hypothetical protein
MTDRAINPDALVAEVNNLADELEAVLVLGPDPAALGAVDDLADRLNELTLAVNFAHTYSREMLLREFGPRFAPPAPEYDDAPTDDDMPF